MPLLCISPNFYFLYFNENHVFSLLFFISHDFIFLPLMALKQLQLHYICMKSARYLKIEQ